MKLSEFLIRDAIITDMEATTKEWAFREIVGRVQDAGYLTGMDPESLTQALLEREGLGSTAIGHGVAVPHAEMPDLDQVICSIAPAPKGVDFDALDGNPVDVLVALLFPPMAGWTIRRDDPNEPFLAFGVVASHFQDDGLLSDLRRCRVTKEVIDLIVEAERPEATQKA